MTPDQEQHLQDIKDAFESLVDKKYRDGVQEHGGNLWRKKHLLDFALDEAIDQVTYLVTLKRQLTERGIELGETEE